MDISNIDNICEVPDINRDGDPTIETYVVLSAKLGRLVIKEETYLRGVRQYYCGVYFGEKLWKHSRLAERMHESDPGDHSTSYSPRREPSPRVYVVGIVSGEDDKRRIAETLRTGTAIREDTRQRIPPINAPINFFEANDGKSK